jgi:hypothetical protein
MNLRWLVLTILGVMLGLASLAAPARADCYTMCSDYVEGNCTEYTQTCTDDTSSAPRLSYGAIAYGRTSEAYGYSHNWGSETKAESVAMHNCIAHGSDCKVMVWFEHKCGAVAARGDHAFAYWGLAYSERDARNEAMSQCVKDKGQQCAVKVSHCSK